jgi:hypothetical protein
MLDVVGRVTCDLDPHAFWKKECDPDALTERSANAWLRSWRMIASIEGSLIPYCDRKVFDATGKSKPAFYGSASKREKTE